jgi:hypothetical protein
MIAFGGWHAMAYDPENNVVVLFGGGPDRSQYTDETWVFDPSTQTWSRIG